MIEMNVFKTDYGFFLSERMRKTAVTMIPAIRKYLPAVMKNE